MNRLAATVLLSGLFCLPVYGQQQDPLTGQAPLVSAEQSDVEREGNRRMWQKTAADNALRSGLAGIAVRLYDRLLENGRLSQEEQAEIRMNRVSAYIALGMMEEADAALEAFEARKNAPYLLRRALVSFFLGERSRAEDYLERIVADDLPDMDLSWYYLLLGLIDRGARNEESESLLNRARLLAVSPEQQAQVDLIIYRSVLLEGRPLEDNQLNRLKTQMENELAEGSRAGVQFAKEYVIALHKLNRKAEALQVIQDTMPRINEAGQDLRDELLLLSGIISGEDTQEGHEAFRELVSRGVTTELRLRALQELVSAADTPLEIETFLRFTDGLDSSILPRQLRHRILYNRAQLLYRTEDFEASNRECDKLLQLEPDMELRESTVRLLTLIAFQRQRYRTAAGLLVELGNLVQVEKERNEIQLLVADCFFQGGDFNDAAESYEVAIQQEGADRGAILFQWVLAEIRAGNLDEALNHVQNYRDDAGIDPVQKWKTVWNLLTALHSADRAQDAYDLLNSWLTQKARAEMPVSLWIRLLWFRCQLSLKTGNYASTPVLAGEVYGGLTDAEGTIDPALGIQVASLTQLLEGQALIFAGRVEEGLELMETIRRDFPSTRAAAESYLAEARYYASENLMVEAQRRFIDLADNYVGSELAPVALYEASLQALTRGTDSTLREANQILNRLAENYPNHPLVFYGRLNQGNLLRSFNDFGGAEVVFEQLLLAFPRHKDRAIVEMAQAECILAQTDTSQSRLDQAIGKFERLAELPDLPIDLRVEASWKWAFSYKRRGNPERVVEIYWLAINQFLINEDVSERLGSTGRYWMSRIIISLGEALEERGDIESARRVYSLIPGKGLPFKNLAESKLSRLGQKKG